MLIPLCFRQHKTEARSTTIMMDELARYFLERSAECATARGVARAAPEARAARLATRAHNRRPENPWLPNPPDRAHAAPNESKAALRGRIAQSARERLRSRKQHGADQGQMQIAADAHRHFPKPKSFMYRGWLVAEKATPSASHGVGTTSAKRHPRHHRKLCQIIGRAKAGLNCHSGNQGLQPRLEACRRACIRARESPRPARQAAGAEHRKLSDLRRCVPSASSRDRRHVNSCGSQAHAHPPALV